MSVSVRVVSRFPTDTGLHPQRILVGGQRVLPALLGIADELLRRGRAGVTLRVESLEGLIDLVDVVGQALRLVEQLLRACERLLDRLQARIRQARQVLRLVEQHLGLVLQAGDLVVDLLQRAGGLQHVLGIVGRVIDDHLRARWCADAGEGEARGADQDHVLNEAMVHGIAHKEGVTTLCGVVSSTLMRSAAQSRPLRRSQAAAKPSRPCSSDDFGDGGLIGLGGCGGEGERDLAQAELEQAVAAA